MSVVLLAAAMVAALICPMSAFADFNDKKPINATITGALGSLVLAFVQLRGRPAEVDVST